MPSLVRGEVFSYLREGFLLYEEMPSLVWGEVFSYFWGKVSSCLRKGFFLCEEGFFLNEERFSHIFEERFSLVWGNVSSYFWGKVSSCVRKGFLLHEEVLPHIWLCTILAYTVHTCPYIRTTKPGKTWGIWRRGSTSAGSPTSRTTTVGSPMEGNWDVVFYLYWQIFLSKSLNFRKSMTFFAKFLRHFG